MGQIEPSALGQRRHFFQTFLGREKVPLAADSQTEQAEAESTDLQPESGMADEEIERMFQYTESFTRTAIGRPAGQSFIITSYC